MTPQRIEKLRAEWKTGSERNLRVMVEAKEGIELLDIADRFQRPENAYSDNDIRSMSPDDFAKVYDLIIDEKNILQEKLDIAIEVLKNIETKKDVHIYAVSCALVKIKDHYQLPRRK